MYLKDISEKIDLTKINIKQNILTLDTIVKRISRDEIDFRTYNDFKSVKKIWTQEIKSKFIESLIIRQPLPAFYFDTTNYSKWLVIDGLQRLHVIKEFIIDKTLKLKNLDFLSAKEFAGKTFDSLPRYAQRNIEEYEIIVYLVEPPTPEAVKQRIFNSINLKLDN